MAIQQLDTAPETTWGVASKGEHSENTPANRPGVFTTRSVMSVELIIQADSQDMIANFVFDMEWRAIHVDRIDRVRSEIKVQIFKLGRPILRDFLEPVVITYLN